MPRLWCCLFSIRGHNGGWLRGECEAGIKIIAKRSAAKFRIKEAECYQAFMREVAASIHRGNNKNWELQAISSNPFPGGGRAKAQSFVRGGRWSDRRRSS